MQFTLRCEPTSMTTLDETEQFKVPICMCAGCAFTEKVQRVASAAAAAGAAAQAEQSKAVSVGAAPPMGRGAIVGERISSCRSR
jgi:hypothetical protein